MSEIQTGAAALLIFGAEPLKLTGAAGTELIFSGAVQPIAAATAEITLGGSAEPVILSPALPATDAAATFILWGNEDVWNEDRTRTLMQWGCGGRALEWGWLQEAQETETGDLQVMPHEDGNAAGVVLGLERTELVCTAIFTQPPYPRRGDEVAWLTADGELITAIVLSRRVNWSNGAAASMSIAATKYDGLHD